MSFDDPQPTDRPASGLRVATRARWPFWLLAVGLVLSGLWTGLLAYEGLRLFQWLAS